ncbi:MAG: hypothetical protein IKV85_04630 [Ruminococcus sp.]|nr:hypothetical protein [Ruminococcus sp.]
MKKIISVILASVLACTSMVACNSADSNSDNGGSKDSKKSEYGCGSKYALNDEDYRFLDQYKKDEVYLLAGKLSCGEENILSDSDTKSIHFYLGEQTDYQDNIYFGFTLYGMDLKNAHDNGIYDGSDVYLLYKNPWDTFDEIRGWSFISEENSEKVFSLIQPFTSEEFTNVSSLKNCNVLGDDGYIFTSAKEADAAYEKMIAEGGISTEKYRSVNSEE